MLSKGNNFNCVFKGYKGNLYIGFRKVMDSPKDKTLKKPANNIEIISLHNMHMLGNIADQRKRSFQALSSLVKNI